MFFLEMSLKMNIMNLKFIKLSVCGHHSHFTPQKIGFTINKAKMYCLKLTHQSILMIQLILDNFIQNYS